MFDNFFDDEAPRRAGIDGSALVVVAWDDCEISAFLDGRFEAVLFRGASAAILGRTRAAKWLEAKPRGCPRFVGGVAEIHSRVSSWALSNGGGRDAASNGVQGLLRFLLLNVLAEQTKILSLSSGRESRWCNSRGQVLLPPSQMR